MELILQIILIPSKIMNFILLKYKKVRTGKNIKINGTIGIYGKGRIEIGNNVIINSMQRFNPIGCGSKTLLQTRNGGEIIIGNNVGMSHCAITAYKGVYIEDNVLLGSGTKIYDTDFHPLSYHDRIEVKGIVPVAKRVHIGEGAFIGAMTIILKGVNIGKHSIVGAGSVVTKDIPDDEIWAGNPAMYIRKIIE